MLKNVGSNWIVTVVTVLAVYLLTPYTIHKLGDDGYGTWNLINSITGYLGLLVLGVPMASVRYFAQHVARGDTTNLNQAIGSCTALYLILGAIALVMGVGMYAFFTVTYHIPASLHVDARWAFFLMVFFVSAGFIALLPSGLLAAHEDFVPRNMVRLWGVVLRLSLTVATIFILYLMEFLSAIAAVVMPMTTRLQAQGKKAELQEIFLKWSKIALSLTLGAGLFLIVLGPRFIAWWVDPTFERPAGQVLQILMVSYLIFLPMRGVALPMLMGLGKAGLPTIGFLVAGVLDLGLSILLVRPLGLAGVALGTAIPNVLFAVMIFVHACREMEVSILAFMRYVIPRAVLGAVPVLALLLWFKLGLEVRSLVELAVAGVAMALLFGGMWVFYVCRNDPYIDPRSWVLPRLRAWGRV